MTEVIMNYHITPNEDYEHIFTRYRRVNVQQQGAKARCQYVDPDTEEVVLENYWNLATGHD